MLTPKERRVLQGFIDDCSIPISILAEMPQNTNGYYFCERWSIFYELKGTSKNLLKNPVFL